MFGRVLVRKTVIGLMLMPLLGGCGAAPVMQSIVDIGRAISPMSREAEAMPNLDPSFRYLRVQVDKRVAYFALGYIDPHPDGSIEVWYSGEKEVLRLQRGRVVGAVGMATEWRGVSLNSPPAWSREMESATFSRVRDVSPGYRYGIHEKLRVQRIPPPVRSSLAGLAPESLVWFEETVDGGGDLPPSRYGLRQDSDKWQVVYSEQCLAKLLCFSWQRWKP